MVFMINNKHSFPSASALRAALTAADEDTQHPRSELFQRANGDVLVIVTMPGADAATDDYLAGQVPTTRTPGVSIVTAEPVTTKRTRPQPLRRVRIATNGAIRFDKVLAAGAVHTQIVRWWEGQPGFTGIL